VTIHADMSEQGYRALPGVSGTQVKTLLTSPAMIGVPVTVTDAMRLGTAFHAALLEDWRGVAVISEVTKNAGKSNTETIECRAWTLTDAQQQRDAAIAEGLTPIHLGEQETILAMLAAVRSHPDAGPIFTANGQAEVSLTWEVDGVPCKGRIDWLAGRVYDVKSIGGVSGDFEDACQKAIGDWGTHGQQMHYASGVLANNLIAKGSPVLVYVERDFPYRVAVIELSDFDAQQGLEMCREAYRRWADCTAAGVWPTGSPEGVRKSRIPQWSARMWDRRVNGETPDASETIAALEEIIGE